MNKTNKGLRIIAYMHFILRFMELRDTHSMPRDIPSFNSLKISRSVSPDFSLFVHGYRYQYNTNLHCLPKNQPIT